jgi:hypothetical protein
MSLFDLSVFESGGELANAANLTDDRQAVSLVSWLCSL